MRIWAIGDLHLSFGVQNKSMDVFGPNWKNHANKIAESWKKQITSEDIILIPGDISWAMRLEDAAMDLSWLDSLAGTKVMIKGNHDYWWGSLKKVSSILPPSIHVIQNNSISLNGVAIGGTRLWDTPEYSFHELIDFQENPKEKKPDVEEDIQGNLSASIFNRELERLKLSLKEMDKSAKVKIVMTHYPPIGIDLLPSRTSQILEEYGVDICVFGHLHNLRKTAPLFGVKNGVRYVLTSSDYLEFQPIQIL